MNIQIQDLGPKWQGALIKRRMVPQIGTAQTHPEESFVPSRVGPLGRWWTRGLGLSPAATALVMTGLRWRGSGGLSVFFSAFTAFGTLGVAEVAAGSGHVAASFISLIAGAGLSRFWIACPRMEIRSVVRKPVTGEEIETLKDRVEAPLERDYLGLVQEIQRQTVSPDDVPQLRGAVRALGMALDQLSLSTAVADARALRAMSVRKQAEAGTEADAVVAASLERQAGALRRSADIAERSARVMRRTAVLRDELSAQIESLRLGLTSFETTSGDVSGLSDLADAVHSVASQANSLADARAELDASLAGTSPVAGDSPSVLQMLRRGGG